MILLSIHSLRIFIIYPLSLIIIVYRLKMLRTVSNLLGFVMNRANE